MKAIPLNLGFVRDYEKRLEWFSIKNNRYFSDGH
jgi:hypothetical protein